MPLFIFIVARELIPFFAMNHAGDSIILILLVVNCMGPALSIYMMKRQGMISSIELQKSSERRGPFTVVIFYYIGAWLLLKWKAPNLWPEVMLMFVAVVVSLTLAMLINFRWKISVHMIAAGGMFGTWMALGKIHHVPVSIALIVAIIVALLVGWSRVKLNAHDPAQVYGGWMLGLLVNYCCIVFL